MTIDNSKEWFRFCRIALEWLNPKRDLEPEKWVVEVVERAKDLNINALAFDFYHGGYAIFNGAVAPKDRHVGDADILTFLDRELHKRDMKLIVMNMGSHCARFTAKEHPEWRCRNAQGEYYKICVDLDYAMCLNSPYSNFLLQELAEFLPRYRIDGLYIEGLYGHLECYCDYCRTEFLNTYGYDIPVDPVQRCADPAFNRFRADVITNFIRRVKKVIREKSPDTVFMPCPSWFEGAFADFNAWGKYADATTLERQWGYKRDTGSLFEIGLSMQVMRALTGRPPFGTLFLAWGVDANYSPCTPQHYRLNFGEILLYGGTPQLHAQTIFENDQSGMPVVREMFDLVEKVRPCLLDAHLVHYAALVIDWTDFKASGHFKGYYKALIEKHIPFEVISKQALTTEAINRYKVILLPNVTHLSDEEIDAIKQFNASGGGVVMTYRTGSCYPDGRLRTDYPLLSIAGVSGPYGIETNPITVTDSDHSKCDQTYYRIVKEHDIGVNTVNRLQSVEGSYVEVELTSGTAIAEALDFDYSRMHRHHPVTGYYPGRPINPLIVVNDKEDNGRVTYFASEFDKATYTIGLLGTLDTLAQAAVWTAAEQPPVEYDMPPTVEAAAHYSPEQNAYTLLMVNQTTNELHPGMVVRYVVPLCDIKITLREINGGVKDVRSLTSSKLEWKVENGVCEIKLDKLKEYEAVLIELINK